MSAPEIKGWCPGALRPMMSGDGLVVRIRAHLGRLTADQASGLSALSTRYGNGLIDLSARANLQLRGVQPADHAALIDGLRDLELVDTCAETEARRNIILTPFWTVQDDSHQIATALATALAGPDAPQLPGKFGFAVDCGDRPVLQNIAADIRFERASNGTLMCRADGSEFGAPVTPETAPNAALELAKWFLESGGAPTGRGRMRAHIRSGARPPEPCLSTACAPTDPDKTAIISVPHQTADGPLVALEFGQIKAADLAALAQLGALRLTPWRMILVETNQELPDLPSLINDPDDPRLRVTACTGAPGCPQALAQTRDLARQLAKHMPRGEMLHVSGCAKGCAHPAPADITLTARSRSTFDLIRNGTAAGQPDKIGLIPSDLPQHLQPKGP